METRGGENELRLSSAGMERVCQYEREKFVFTVGDKDYECGVSQACFLSGKVSRLLMSDSTAHYMEVDIDDGNDSFEDFLRLGEGYSIKVDDGNRESLKSISYLLENLEVYSAVVGFELRKEAVSVENVLRRLETKVHYCLDCSEEISFFASHFYEFDADSVSSLDVCDLERILCASELKLKDENSLVDMIVHLCERDEEYHTLFRYVQIEYVDLSHLNIFLEHVYPDRVDSYIWERICDCLRGQFCSDCKPLPHRLHDSRFERQDETFVFTKGQLFSGIMSHLSKECGGNVHEKGVMNITASGESSGSCYQVTDYGWRCNFWTDAKESSWICFDFKDRTVELTSYSLKMNTDLNYRLLHWIIEGSTDGSKWEAIDERNVPDAKGSSNEDNYSCSGTGVAFRYIRIRQIGKNNRGSEPLFLNAIEFFGTIFKSAAKQRTTQ